MQIREVGLEIHLLLVPGEAIDAWRGPALQLVERKAPRRAYLQIAESRRVGGQVRQRVIATLGRLDVLAASGQLERLLRSGARFASQAMVLSAAQDDPTAAMSCAPDCVCSRSTRGRTQSPSERIRTEDCESARDPKPA